MSGATPTDAAAAQDLCTDPFDDDKLNEECGVFGVFGEPDAAVLAVLGLHALQHRGQQSTGMVTYDGNQFHNVKGIGHVAKTYSDQKVRDELQGHMAIGHVRYATTGGMTQRNIQPLFAEYSFGGMAIAHNGNLTNAQLLRRKLQEQGSLFQSTSDTEVVVHLIAKSMRDQVEARLIDALIMAKGAFSMLAMTEDALFGIRDPMGVRPLVIGQTESGNYVLTSETCALDIIGAKFLRDVAPGEMVMVTKDGLTSTRPFPEAPSHFCIFEYIYFSRPDSQVEGRNVYKVRKAIGEELAVEKPVEADVVVPVPDSGVPAALGFAEKSGLPFELGIIRNHYVGRTFIQPTQSTRDLSVQRKHSANRGALQGKRVILVDDSIVRGTTSKKIVNMVKAAGAAEVHLRISSPPTMHPCFYGIDTPEKGELMAAQKSVEEMCTELGADSLAFISIDGLYRAAGHAKRNKSCPQFCDACFSGDYPIHNEDGEYVKSLGSKHKSLLHDRPLSE
ncbi:MAG: amidophosphoribosyltransferase [Rhodospirillaceae bacterium]